MTDRRRAFHTRPGSRTGFGFGDAITLRRISHGGVGGSGDDFIVGTRP